MIPTTAVEILPATTNEKQRSKVKFTQGILTPVSGQTLLTERAIHLDTNPNEKAESDRFVPSRVLLDHEEVVGAAGW